MYIPSHFEETRLEVLHALIHRHPLAALVTTGANGIQANHIPFMLDPEPAPFGTLRGHVARANPVWRETDRELEALVIFQGPNAYISPNWYPSKHETGRVVPTWNYAVVHAYGRLQIVERSDWLRNHLDALVDQHEDGRTPPWQISGAPEEFTGKLMNAIVGLEIQITRLEGKWKLGQNRSSVDRQGAVDGLRKEGTESAEAVAALMETLAE
ncbi:MAG TPA: FMN-binding negative transcriptional regulator [Gammaproteobacteria bacterium]